MLRDNQPYSMNGKSLLIVVITDGEPTDMSGHLNETEFEQCLLNLPHYVYTGLVSLGNDARSAAYLDMMKRELPRVNFLAILKKNQIYKNKHETV